LLAELQASAQNDMLLKGAREGRGSGVGDEGSCRLLWVLTGGGPGVAQVALGLAACELPEEERGQGVGIQGARAGAEMLAESGLWTEGGGGCGDGGEMDIDKE
jgi:hypothetical protein